MTDLESLYDKPKLLKANIEEAILHASLLNSAIKSDITEKLLNTLQFIQNRQRHT